MVWKTTFRKLLSNRFSTERPKRRAFEMPFSRFTLFAITRHKGWLYDGNLITSENIRRSVLELEIESVKSGELSPDVHEIDFKLI